MEATSIGERLTLDAIRRTSEKIRPHIKRTPIWHWRGGEITNLLGTGTEIHLKMELFQQTGTFKARGALSNMLALTRAELDRGVTAMSSGNHAVAVAYAARTLGSSAKVVMQKTANRLRIEMAESYGAKVIIAEDGVAGFAQVEQIAADEGRAFIHPFEGRRTALGSATLGLEFCADTGPLDAVIVSVGGGGLAGGFSSAVKLVDPECTVYGVEPEGADCMRRSFASGQPESIKPNTIADSLAPPMTLPYSFNLCRSNIDRLVTIDDDAICQAMGLLFRDMKLAVEPACAAATAALTGPLREELSGRKVGIVLCGSNIDWRTFSALMERGHALHPII
jgi:threonine dehydratase